MSIFFSFLFCLHSPLFCPMSIRFRCYYQKIFLANLVLHNCWNYIFEIDGNMQLKRQAKISAYVVATVQLLQHVLPDHGGENSTMNKRMSIDAVLVTLSSAWRVISSAWRMPKLFRVLKNDSRPGGCNAWAKVQNSFKKRTSSFRRTSSVLSSVSCANNSVRNFSSSCKGKIVKKVNQDTLEEVAVVEWSMALV